MAVDYTATIDGKSYGFDFEDQRIDVDATIDVLNVVDLYEAIKDAQGSLAGMTYATIADAEGLASLSAGIKTFLTVSLRTAWEVNTLKTSGKFEVSGGNLIRADGADPFRDNSLITYIAFLSQAGIQAEGGTGGATPAEIWAYLINSNAASALLEQAASSSGGGGSSEPEVIFTQ